jgi:hypothetical protein
MMEQEIFFLKKNCIKWKIEIKQEILNQKLQEIQKQKREKKI